MKKIYLAPEMEIIAFETEDVITASGMKNAGSLGDLTGDGDISINP